MESNTPGSGGLGGLNNRSMNRLTRTAIRAQEVAARAAQIRACQALHDRPDVPGPDEETARDRAVRQVIMALASEHPGKAARFAQLSIPARFAAGLAALFGAQGYRVVLGASLTAEYRTITVWPGAVLGATLALTLTAPTPREEIVTHE